MNNEMFNDFCDETELLLKKLNSHLHILSGFTIGYKYPSKNIKEQHRIQDFEADAINECCNVLNHFIAEAREISEINGRGEENDN
jgi:hypothetical protein